MSWTFYERPYDPEIPVVCMDEKTCQLLGHEREPLPMRPGSNRKEDSNYVRLGTCSIFSFVEPQGGVHHVSVHEHRTAVDWAQEIKYLADEMYPDARKIVVVTDNLNAHRQACKAFPPSEARRILWWIELHYIPGQRSWLNIGA